MDQKKFRFIREREAVFSEFFLKLYTLPYNWSILSYDEFDYVIRFERLQEDFFQALKLIGIEPKRPLSLVNKTSKKEKEAIAYITPLKLLRGQKLFLGYFMKVWGYTFPPEWGETPVGGWPQAKFEALTAVRKFYWRFLRNRI